MSRTPRLAPSLLYEREPCVPPSRRAMEKPPSLLPNRDDYPKYLGVCSSKIFLGVRRVVRAEAPGFRSLSALAASVGGSSAQKDSPRLRSLPRNAHDVASTSD